MRKAKVRAGKGRCFNHNQRFAYSAYPCMGEICFLNVFIEQVVRWEKNREILVYCFINS